MKRNNIAQTLSAALTLQSTVGIASAIQIDKPTEAARAISPFQPKESATGMTDPIKTETSILLSHPENEFSLRISPPDNWQENNTTERYKKLAIKEATSRLTKSEQQELNSLEELRDRAENIMTGAQIIEQYRRERTGLEMLRILHTYVRVEPQG